MSPVGDSLRIRCRKFPALVDCCTIDWFNNWPGEAIELVTIKLLEEEKLGETAKLAKLIRVVQ